MKQVLLALLLIICVASYFFPGRYFAPTLGSRFTRKLPNSFEQWRELASPSDRNILFGLDEQLRTQPIEVLQQLARHEIRVQPELQNWLAFEALENLTRILNGSKDFSRAEAILHHAKGIASRLKSRCEILPDLILSIRMEIEGKRQRGGLRQVVRLFEKKEWTQAETLARELNTSSAPGQIRSALEKTIQFIENQTALDLVEKALELENQSAGTSHEIITTWDHLKPWNLPESMQLNAAELRGIRLLETMISNRWESAPDTKKIRQNLEDFRNGSQNGSLASQIQENLAMKALMEGYPRVALNLLPTQGDSNHAKKLLSDFITLIEGSGGPISTLAEAVGTPLGTKNESIPGLVLILGPNHPRVFKSDDWVIPTTILKKFQARIPALNEALGQSQIKGRADLQDRIVRVEESLHLALIQANIEEEEMVEWLNKLGSRGFMHLTGIQKALALEMKREKMPLDESVKFLKNLPNYLNQIDHR